MQFLYFIILLPPVQLNVLSLTDGPVFFHSIQFFRKKRHPLQKDVPLNKKLNPQNHKKTEMLSTIFLYYPQRLLSQANLITVRMTTTSMTGLIIFSPFLMAKFTPTRLPIILKAAAGIATAKSMLPVLI